LTYTSTSRTPFSSAFLAALVEAICAAKGVERLEPLKPAVPVEAQHMVLPPRSVIVIMVLLKVAQTCAMPLVTPLKTFFFEDLGFGLGL
jgi:hypothetical protein